MRYRRNRKSSIDKRDGLGLITLNRPKAINALNHAMVRQIAAALDRLGRRRRGPRGGRSTGAGERGLCAGGDIVSIYHDAQGRRHRLARTSGARSTSSTPASRATRKPYVAIMDGIVMGGGVGVSAHGSIRIVTERSMIGMPEVGIGFVPDVGGTYLLARAPGELGTHVALTTARLERRRRHRVRVRRPLRPVARRSPQLLDALSHRRRCRRGASRAFAEPAPESALLAQQELDRRRYSRGHGRGDRRAAAGAVGCRRPRRRPSRCCVEVADRAARSTLRSLRRAAAGRQPRGGARRGVPGVRRAA